MTGFGKTLGFGEEGNLCTDDETSVLEGIQDLMAGGHAMFCKDSADGGCLQLTTGEMFTLDEKGITRLC